MKSGIATQNCKSFETENNLFTFYVIKIRSSRYDDLRTIGPPVVGDV